MHKIRRKCALWLADVLHLLRYHSIEIVQVEQPCMSGSRNVPSLSVHVAHEDDDGATVDLRRAGAYLETLRRRQKLTQQDVADAVDVGRGTIDRVEAGAEEVKIRTV